MQNIVMIIMICGELMQKTLIISAVAITLLLVFVAKSVIENKEVSVVNSKNAPSYEAMNQKLVTGELSTASSKTTSCEETLDVSKMNACAQKAYEVSERRLKKTYIDVTASFYQPTEKLQFESAHTKWKTFRQAYCDFATHLSQKAPGFLFEKYDCLDRVTKQYIQNLERYIEFNADA